MCRECWVQDGKPQIVTPGVLAAVKAIEAVYDWSSNGGDLHIVLDDWNLDDRDLEACAEFIAENHREYYAGQIEAERACLEAMRSLSVPERGSALALYEGFFEAI